MAESTIAQSDEDAEISRILRYGIGQSVGWAESKLSRERTRVAEYIDGTLPKRMHNGDSSFNSYDVFEGVESMKAQILETFSANSRPVMFNQGPPPDTNDAAALRTDYVNDVVMSQNPGFNIFRDVIDNGLKDRAGIVKVWWKADVHEEEYRMAAPTAEELQAHLAANEKHSLKELTIDEDGQTIKEAILTITKDRSQVKILVMPGEEFGISPMATSIAEADLVYHRYTRTVSQLIKEGYDPKIVKKLQSNDKLWMQMEPERVQRFESTDDIIGLKGNENGQLASRQCTVYECYSEFDLAKKGSSEEGVSHLYKVVLVGDTVLDKERVDRKPFVAYIPLPRSNSFWGQNYAKMLQATQTARTYLTRSIINHTLITNNPRMLVVKGSLDNPRELMENRFGGLINVKRPDGVVPMPQSGLNPFVFQTVQMLQANKEELTGISALSQGLDKDAISKQNSQDMVHELITVSQIRQKIVARNFAENFLRDLYSAVYLLVVENEREARITEISGQGWVPVDFTQWPQDCRMSVSFALGYGEEKQEMQKWLALDVALSNQPELAGQYGLQQKDAVIRNAMKAAGIRDTQTYLLPVQQATPKPPDPLHAAEVAAKQADATLKNAQAQGAQSQAQMQAQELQFKARENDIKLQIEQLKLQMENLKVQSETGKANFESQKLQLETMKVQGELQLKRDELSHKIVVDAAEVRLQQEAMAQDKLQAEAQPTR